MIDNDFFTFNWDIDQKSVETVTKSENMDKMIQLKGYQKMVLSSLLELTKDPSEKKRIFDDFAFIFMLNFKIF